MTDDTKSSNELIVGADELYRSNNGIPMNVVFVHDSDKNISNGDVELYDDDWSSIGDDFVTFEPEIYRLYTGFLLSDIVKSTYKDLEDIHRTPFQSFGDENNEERSKGQTKNNIVDPFILSGSSFSFVDHLTSTTNDEIFQKECEERKQKKQQILTKENGLPIINDDDDDWNEDISFVTSSNLQWLIQGEVMASTSVTCRTRTAQGRKIRRKKQTTINLRTKVERIQHQVIKPFRTASKMIVWSMGRLNDTICQGPDPGLFLTMNHSILQRRNTGLLLSDDDTVSLPGQQSIPNIVETTNPILQDSSSNIVNQSYFNTRQIITRCCATSESLS